MDKYSHLERIQMILAGEKPDRFAASLWRHYFHMEHYAEGLAEAMLHFQKEFDWDFMKINPRADYHVQDWGLELEYSKNEFAKHKKVKFPVEKISDWQKITTLTPNAPALAEHLKAVSLIRKKSDRELPLLMTIFTPLSIAGRMVADRQILADHLRTNPKLVHRALQAITDTYIKFTEELRNAGADGIFFATCQWAAEGLISWTEYQEFGLPYDLEVINASGDDAINLFHVCDSNNYLQQLSEIDYNSKILNWDTEDPTNLPLDKACEVITDKILVGGIDYQGWLTQSGPEEVGYKIDEMKSKLDPARVILGPGCAIDPDTPEDNIKMIRTRL